MYTEQKGTFFNGLTQQWGAGKLPPSQEAQIIFSILFVYALDHTGSAKHGLRNLHKIDSEWGIFTSRWNWRAFLFY